jgi:hypothetical protein
MAEDIQGLLETIQKPADTARRLQDLLDAQEDGETLRQHYTELISSVSDLGKLYEHAAQEALTAVNALPEGKPLSDAHPETVREILLWQKRRKVLRSMLRETHEPRLPSEKYERRLRAAARAYEAGMGFREVAQEASRRREIDVGPSTIRKDLKDAFSERHDFESRMNAGVLPSLLQKELDHWGIDREVERVE